MVNFNPRSPRGERQIIPIIATTTPTISIHAPREGSDTETRLCNFSRKIFQSTLPARGATLEYLIKRDTQKNFNPRSPRGERPFDFVLTLIGRTISIHAPREGSDTRCALWAVSRGEFQSTLPARGATDTCEMSNEAYRISIHAPREGSDCGCPLLLTNSRDFNPRSPRGERLKKIFVKRFF